MIKCLHHVRITDFRTIHIILKIIENTNTWSLYSERCVKIIRNTLSSISTMCRLQIAEELSQLLTMLTTAAVNICILKIIKNTNTCVLSYLAKSVETLPFLRVCVYVFSAQLHFAGSYFPSKQLPRNAQSKKRSYQKCKTSVMGCFAWIIFLRTLAAPNRDYLILKRLWICWKNPITELLYLFIHPRPRSSAQYIFMFHFRTFNF